LSHSKLCDAQNYVASAGRNGLPFRDIVEIPDALPSPLTMPLPNSRPAASAQLIGKSVF
jgi:hypothetical protein